jgi:penicillin-binding protein 2
MAFLGQEEQIREFQDRFRYIYAVVFLALGLLLSRMVFLQVLKGDQMRRYSEENRIKRVKVAAPRGMIFDRNRKMLIDNRPAFDLEITPQYLKESKRDNEVIALLSKLIHMSEADIKDVLDRGQYQASFLPVKVKTDLTRDEVASVESWKIEMPGVEVREEIKRTNIYGDVAAHLLGYIGEVNPTELPILNKTGIKYKLGDDTGKFGLEQRMEDTLRGVDGEDIKEVDALGRIKLDKGRGRVLSSNLGRTAYPGKNLILTIDQDLQEAAIKGFGDKIGSMVALDPRSGEILAMLSRPSFDPTEFSRGIPAAIWNKLLNDENHPLRDKAIQDHYSPGSTFKPFTAIAGLQEGLIDENSKLHCSGSIRFGNRVYHCWKKGGHGDINVVTAITQSCDVFFYRLAQKFKSVDDIAKWAMHFGLGRKTGISLAREVPGLMPTEEWKKDRLHQEWNDGETLSVAIGQSYTLVTALQLANAYGTIGNGGTLYRPFLVKAIESYEGQVLEEFHPEIIEKAPLNPKTIQLVKEGLWGVVNTPHGTAYTERLPGMDMAGKTGTAQVINIASDKIYQNCFSLKFHDRHNGLFVAFAPVNDPKIVVAVIGEHVCHGAAAAPIASSVIKTYLQKYEPALYSEKAIAQRLEGQTAATSMPTKAQQDAQNAQDEDVTDNNTRSVADPEDNALPPPLPPIMQEVPPQPAPPLGPSGGHL